MYHGRMARRLASRTIRVMSERSNGFPVRDANTDEPEPLCPSEWQTGPTLPPVEE
jgi:hypothetical protein